MYTIYTYWNAEGVIAVLNAIVLIMGGGDFLGLMRTLAVAGMLVGVGVGLAKMSAKEPMQYFVFLGLFYFGLFVPKVTVDVVDLRTGQVGTVANVPFGVAFFYSSTSHVGKFLTETFETNFQPIPNLRFGTTGMSFGARAFQEVSSARVGDPKLIDALKLFTQSCINPEVLDDTDKYKALVNSTDIMTTISAAGWLNPARFVTMPNRTDGTYVYFSCATIPSGPPSAIAEITAWINAETTTQLQNIARRMFPDKQNTTANWAPAIAAIGGALADVEGYMLNTARTAQEQVKQGMMANAIIDSGGSLAVARGDAAAMQAALSAKMAEMQANGAYRTMALIGESALPKFRNIAELVIFSIFPIVLLLIILGGEKGGAVLKQYVVVGIWVQLWAPLYAIVNFLMQDTTANNMQAALEGAVSQTMANTAALGLMAFKQSSLAGGLVMAVPVIAYALVRGGEVAMSGAMGALTGPASNGASSQGGAVGLGNVQVGNTSWGNHSGGNISANKWDTSGSISQGSWASTRGGFQVSGDTGQSVGGWGDGSHRVNAQGRDSNLAGLSASLGMAFGSTVQSQYSNAWMKGQEATSGLVNTIQSAFGVSQGVRSTSGTGMDVAATWASGTNTSNGRSFDKAFTDQLQWGHQAGLTMGETVALSAAASAGTGAFASALDKLAGGSTDAKGNHIPASEGVKRMAALLRSGKVGADVNAAVNSNLKSTYDLAKTAGDTEAFKGGLSNAITNSSGTTTSRTSRAGTERDSGRRASYDDVVQAQNAARQSFGEAQQYQELQQRMAQGGGTISTNLANAYVSQKGVEAAEKITRGGGGGAAQLQEMKEFLNAQAAVLAGIITPTQPQVQGAGGAQGAAVKAEASAAARPGTPPAPTAQQVDAVQGNYSDGTAAVGRGPSNVPASVKGPDGTPVTAASVQQAATTGQANANADLTVAGQKVQAAVSTQQQLSAMQVDKAGQPGGQVTQVAKEGARVATDLYDAATTGAANVINKALGQPPATPRHNEGSVASRSPLVRGTLRSYKDVAKERSGASK